jgi:hypothetical protein
MLANLLPGIRELRTPLATGYIWLLTFWLWIPDHFKDRPPTRGAVGDIARLAHYSGRLGVGIALSFVAYLTGALSELFNYQMTRLGSFIHWYRFVASDIRVQRSLALSGKRIRRQEAWAISDQETRKQSRWAIWREDRWATLSVGAAKITLRRRDFFDYEVSGITNDPGYWGGIAMRDAQYSIMGLYSLAEVAGRMTPKPDSNTQRRGIPPLFDRVSATFAYLIREVYKLGNELLGKEPELFSAYDRLIAEYDFRIGIAAPLVALSLTLTVRWTPLWLLILLPLLLLLKTGVERRMEAGDLLAEAARQGRLSVVLPPDLESHDEDDEDE